MLTRRRFVTLLGLSLPGFAQATPALQAAMQRARELRDAAVRAGDQPYGAVVMRSNEIVGEGPSRVVAKNDHSAHAEREAIRDALRRLKTEHLTGCVLVSTSRPCRDLRKRSGRSACRAHGAWRCTHRCGAAAMRAWHYWALLLFLPLTALADDALILAAARGNAAEVKRLLDSGAPVNARDVRGRNAALAATQGGHVGAATLLIARGADVNAQDDIRDSAFLLAGARGHTEIVRAALAAGANLKSTNRFGGTALIPACHYGHVETVRLLLTTAIDVNHYNNLGWTALLEAVILGDGGARHTEIVKLLLAHGAALHLADKQGITPLVHAEQRGQRAIAQLLRAATQRTR